MQNEIKTDVFSRSKASHNVNNNLFPAFLFLVFDFSKVKEFREFIHVDVDGDFVKARDVYGC